MRKISLLLFPINCEECAESFVSLNANIQLKYVFDTIMANSFTDKIEWTLIFAMEFGRHFGLTLKQAFNYLSRFGAIKFVDEHYDYCHTQSFQSMVSDMAEYCRRKGGALV